MQPEAPIFSISSLKPIEGTRKVGELELQFIGLECETRLSPYTIGVTQNMKILISQTPQLKWGLLIQIQRLTGSLSDWIRLNRTTLTTLRQQLLLWRSFTIEQREKYMKIKP
jgi:hypothetical protein